MLLGFQHAQFGPPLEPDFVDQAIENYRALVRIPTISRLGDRGTNWAPFEQFREDIAARYPQLHGSLSLEIVREHAMLFRWRGMTDTEPTVLMAHYDVVPVEDESAWTVPPFAADIVDVDGEPTSWRAGASMTKPR